MQATNEKERANAYGLWLAMLTVLIFLFFMLGWQTSSVPAKELADNRARLAAAGANSGVAAGYRAQLIAFRAKVDGIATGPDAAANRPQVRGEISSYSANMLRTDSSMVAKIVEQACIALQQTITAQEKADLAGGAGAALDALKTQVDNCDDCVNKYIGALNEANDKLQTQSIPAIIPPKCKD